MTTHDESNDLRRSSQRSGASESNSSRLRLSLLFSLLAIALFALWYDYKVARPAVEQAYQRVTAMNHEINSAAIHRVMNSVDVQTALGRTPSETFISGSFTVEAYRWNAGLPIELYGFSGDESPSIGFKTHDYYAVYRKNGPEYVLVTHFKFGLDWNELAR